MDLTGRSGNETASAPLKALTGPHSPFPSFLTSEKHSNYAAASLNILKSLWEPELVAELKKQAQPLPNDPEKKPRPTLLDMPDYDKLSRWYCMDFGKLVFEKTK